MTLAGGERLDAAAVVCALPVGPLRAVEVRGVPDARLRSLHRQRHALAAKLVATYRRSVWAGPGRTALAYGEGLLGSTWPQGTGVLSMLVAPERLGLLLAAPDDVALRADVAAELRALYGEDAGVPDAAARPALGDRPVDARLRDALAPRRRHGGRAAARHARAAVLRVRLRPVGRGLHGGRGADRTRGGRRGAAWARRDGRVRYVGQAVRLLRR